MQTARGAERADPARDSVVAEDEGRPRRSAPTACANTRPELTTRWRCEMPRRWVLPLICLYVVLVIVVIAWPGQRDVLATIVDFTTVYVLTSTLVAVLR